MNVKSHSIGVIKDIKDGIVIVDYHGDICVTTNGNAVVIEKEE